MQTECSLDIAHDRLWKPIMGGGHRKRQQVRTLSNGQFSEKSMQATAQSKNIVAIRTQAEAMLDNCWQFDPNEHAVPIARGVLDPSYGFTDEEHEWLNHIKTGRSEITGNQLIQETVAEKHFIKISDEQQDELLLDEVALDKELNAFYGHNEDEQSREGISSSDQKHIDAHDSLLLYDWDDLNEVALWPDERIQTEDANYVMQTVNDDDRSAPTQLQHQIIRSENSGVFLGDNFDPDVRKPSPTKTRSSPQEIVGLHGQG